MKQLILNLKSGRVSLENVAVPLVKEGHVLIRTSYSLISSGTERMLVDFAASNWLTRVKQHPEKVKAVFRKMMREGVLGTLSAVNNRLDQPLALGYSQTGVVVEVGAGVRGLRVGDRVSSNGPHAEYVCVPENLVVRVPDGVKEEHAAFTAVGAVALQSIRLLQPTLGETVVVMGLGLIGVLTAQLLKANGCQVIGSDPDEAKRSVAKRLGIIAFDPKRLDLSAVVYQYTSGNGADGVVIAASAPTDNLISAAAELSRPRGRIVLTGVTDMHLNRADFYEKELSFQVSCSYGPGRYETAYTEKGFDYPLGQVRWTLNRNFQAFLQLVASGSIDLAPLVSEVVPIQNGVDVFEKLRSQASLGCLLQYAADPARSFPHDRIRTSGGALPDVLGIGIIGAGNFVRMTLLPALKGFPVTTIASASGLSAASLAEKYRIPYATTDYNCILEDPKIDLVIVATRHDLHAKITLQALRAGKHVWVEKPLALSNDELDEIVRADCGRGFKGLTVGFNRRFSPYVKKAKTLMDGASIQVIATMNAGPIDLSRWVHDLDTGGGRLLGEACHLIDLITYLVGSPVLEVCASYLGDRPKTNDDNASILLRFVNGSVGTVHYFSTGSYHYPKERIEVHGNGKSLVIDDYSSLKGFGFNGFSRLQGKVDKGHAAMVSEVLASIASGSAPVMTLDEVINVSRASLAVYDSFIQHRWVSVDGGAGSGKPRE
jgi:predicted dehydrogenase/threonine dehydrogenase-like Zn-dependent dehydrogenase